MFKGKVVVITGASSGIGAATAKAFSREGASIAIIARNEERLADVASECRNLGAEDVLHIVGDLSKEDQIISFATRVKNHFNSIDVLVNNAATAVVCTFLETTMLEYDRIFNTNVRATFQLTQLIIPELVKSKGCIVNLTSITGTTIMPKGLAYGMSKSALNHFTEALAFEYAPYGVRINAVSPACVKTRQLAGDTAEHKLTQEETDASLAFMSCIQPLGSLGGLISADGVAKSILFLASPAASSITGHVLKMEAGCNVYYALQQKQ